jgi:hypothetical protein
MTGDSRNARRHRARPRRDARATTITAETLDFAQDLFVRLVGELLLDPYGVLQEVVYTETEPESFARLRRIATDLGFDFDELAREFGTPVERDRLRRIETAAPPEGPRDDQ